MMSLRRRGTSMTVRARIETAPKGYAGAHRPADVARHAHLLDPLPGAGEVRVVATPGGAPRTWNLDIAARDRTGLLARFTGVLASQGIDVTQAVVATWDDGAALQAFIVRSPDSPDVVALQRCLEYALDAPLAASAVRGARVSFDHAATAAYTACEVVAPDRPGLLHAIAMVITNAGADIHAASVSTVDGVGRDCFDLTDADGNKLSAATCAAVERELVGLAELN